MMRHMDDSVAWVPGEHTCAGCIVVYMGWELELCVLDLRLDSSDDKCGVSREHLQ